MKHLTPSRLLSEVVVPALDEMTNPGEVSSIRVVNPSDDNVTIEVDFMGETFRCWLIEPGVKDSVPRLGSFASDLQDFIAESAGAWGELRIYPDQWNH